MQAHDIIKKPLLSEKNTEAQEIGRYSFLVDNRASKDEIKDAIQKLYKVEVVQVNTQVRKGKIRRMKVGMIRESDTKKATVRVKSGQTIELF
ncbi:MAG TPA: 50S ribosomal protein L23 [Phycisphaerales bacterium]|nr:50S ribosomal protein L23 [Phycisphaerales bacterium]